MEQDLKDGVDGVSDDSDTIDRNGGLQNWKLNVYAALKVFLRSADHESELQIASNSVSFIMYAVHRIGRTSEWYRKG